MSYTNQIIITADWILNYANSIGAPIQKRSDKLVAPATMPILFWQSFVLPIFQENLPLLHGSQQFIYEEPILEGMILDCELSLSSKEQKQGKHGIMTIFTYTLTCKECDRKIVTSNTVLIQVGEHK